MLAETMATLVGSCLRTSAVLCAAWAITGTMRRASASTRHFVWMCAIAGSIAASAMSFAGPAWNLSIPSPLVSTAETVALDATQDAMASTTPTHSTNGSAVSTPAPTTAAVAASRSSLDLTLAGALLWMLGAISVLAFFIVGAVGSWRIRRSTSPLKAAWVDEAHVLAEAFEINGPIAVVESNDVTMPVVCGIWRPLIVMPQGATQWTDERRRVVVLHELAHIKRRDCLTQAIAHVVCAAYWFNPIVWLAARRLRAERERACDDFVLAAGERGSDYAAHLLDIAQTMRRRRSAALMGVAMAQPSQLEGRLLAILDPAIRRSSTLPTRLALLGLLVVITLPVGAVQLQGSTRTAETRESPTNFTVKRGSPNPAATPLTQVESRQTLLEVVPGATADQVGAEIGETFRPKRQRRTPALAVQNSATADPKTIEALIAALGDSDPDVREMVVVTLGRMRDPRIVPALLPLLKDTNADVREQVVFALARTGDAQAIAAVSTMIDDASPDVREQVVHLLGRSRNRDAVPVLIKALTDSSADVREQAAFALGQLRDAGAVEPLLGMLKDDSADVRKQAAFALGQIRDGKAVDGLVAALQDSDADVREQAALALGRLRDPKAIPSLTVALRDAATDVRKQAAFAIGQISVQQ